MFRYVQFCPLSKAAEVLGERWSMLVIRELLLGHTQFSQLQRALPKISPTTLSKRLADLQEHGLIVRQRAPRRQHHEYQLSAAGRELYPLMMQLAEWGMRWMRDRMRAEELDVSMLMCDVQRRLDPQKLPSGQTVLKFEFTDIKKYADWWVWVVDGEVDLCQEDPGHEVDVLFTSDVMTMTQVWMGDLPLERALASRKLRVLGPATYVKSLHAWFPLHALSATRPAARSS
jgi:DNA-binding HxlR family transcriptional regulator